MGCHVVDRYFGRRAKPRATAPQAAKTERRIACYRPRHDADCQRCPQRTLPESPCSSRRVRKPRKPVFAGLTVPMLEGTRRPARR